MKEFTLLQAANTLGITKNTVKYRLKKIPSELYRRDEKGIIFISGTGLEELRKIGINHEKEPIKPEVNHDKPLQPAEQPQREETVKHAKTTQEQSENLYSALLLTVETLQKQLEVKDQQIAALTEALQTAQRTAEAAQALHAGTIQQQLEQPTQDNTEPVGTSETNSKNKERDPSPWWKRIFSK